MSDRDIGLIVIFGPLVLALAVLLLIEFADRLSTAHPRTRSRNPSSRRRLKIDGATDDDRLHHT
jgi:hypothetical protein